MEGGKVSAELREERHVGLARGRGRGNTLAWLGVGVGITRWPGCCAESTLVSLPAGSGLQEGRATARRASSAHAACSEIQRDMARCGEI